MKKADWRWKLLVNVNRSPYGTEQKAPKHSPLMLQSTTGRRGRPQRQLRTGGLVTQDATGGFFGLSDILGFIKYHSGQISFSSL